MSHMMNTEQFDPPHMASSENQRKGFYLLQAGLL